MSEDRSILTDSETSDLAFCERRIAAKTQTHAKHKHTPCIS